MTGATPRLRMFAGPNGSGKSLLARQLSRELGGLTGLFYLHEFLNADNLQRDLSTAGIDLKRFGLRLSRGELAAQLHGLGRLANDHPFFAAARLEDGILHAPDTVVDSYVAASLVDYLRMELLAVRRSFSFETVMSHRSKVSFLAEAANWGYRTYLYFVATESAQLNIRRVQSRVREGGHDVPSEKIIERYQRSLELFPEAVAYATRAFIFDNSGAEPIWLAEYLPDGTRELRLPPDQLPAWFRRALPGPDLT
jgi:predicted ABC-type ATPase